MPPRFPLLSFSRRPSGLVVSALLVGALAAGFASGVRAAGEPAAQPAQAMSSFGAYLAGSDAAHQSDYPTALTYLGQALKADPDNVNLLQDMVMVMIGAGKLDDAATLSQRLAAQDKQSPIANLVLALADTRAGKLTDADTALDAMPRAGINNLLLPLVRGWVAAGRKDADAAYAALRPLGDVSSFASMYNLHRALIADFVGDTDTAKAAFKSVLQAESQPGWRTVSLVGNFDERHGDEKRAKAQYDEFHDRNPETTLLDPAYARLKAGQKPQAPVSNAAQGIGEALFDVATVIQRERPGGELAMVYTQLASWMRPDSDLIKMLLADVLESQSREPEAIAIYKTIDPKSSFGWTARQHAALGRDSEGDTDGAIADLKAMAAERPARSDALADLGDLLRNHQRFPEAVQAYDQAITRIGKLDKRHWALIFDRGIANDRAGNKQAAEADLQKALELQPDEPYVLNYLGYSWIDEGKNLDRAKQMIEKAVQLKPQDGEIVDSLGWADYKLGLYDDAVKNLEHAVELRAQDATINDHLGDAYWRVGRKIEARFQWRRAQGLDTDHELGNSIQKKLANGLPSPAEVPPTAAKP